MRIGTEREAVAYDCDGEYIYTDDDRKYELSLLLNLSQILYDYENYPTNQDIINHFNLNENECLDLIYALEHGLLDKYLKEYSKEKQVIYFNSRVSEYLTNYFEEYTFNMSKYSIIGMEWARLQDIDGYLPFSIVDVLNVYDKLEYYSRLNFTDWQLITDTGNVDISRLLFNLYNHVFDKWIFMYLSDDYIYHKHKRKVYNPLYRMNYMIHRIDGNRFVYMSGKKSNYTIEDIINLKKEISNFEDYPTNFSLGRIIGSTVKSTYNRVIWNVEEGVYDKWINKYKFHHSVAIDSVVIKDYFDRLLSHVEPYNVFECTNENVGNHGLHSRKPYEYYFKYKDRRGSVRLSVFSKSDVGLLKNAYDNRELVHLGDYCSLVPHIGIDTVKRVLVSIICGRFDKFF